MITETTGPVKHANINASAEAATQIVAAVTDRAIRVLALVLSNVNASTAVNATIEDQNGTDLIGPVRLASGGQLVLPASGLPYAQTPSGLSLRLRLSAAVQVAGSVTYQEVKA